MTHADLVARAVRWLRSRHRCPVVFAEMTTRLPVTPDAIGFLRSGISHLVECKTSRSDFRADQKKIAHRLPHLMPGDFRWYLTPPGLLIPDEIPVGWGLAECGPRQIRIVRDAPRIVRATERVEVDMLVSACIRHQLGVEWREDEARFAPYHSLKG